MARRLAFTLERAEGIIDAAARCIREGGVLSMATESSYALAAGIDHPEAVGRLAKMKGNRPTKPFLVLVGETSWLGGIVSCLPKEAEALMKAFWPGPLTLILPAVRDLDPALTAGTGTVGVRQPGGELLLTLLRAIGPVTGTSANRSGEPSLNDPSEIEQQFGEEVDLIVDSGPSPGGLPSTLVKVSGPIRMLREGPISAGAVQEVLSSLGLTLLAPGEPG